MSYRNEEREAQLLGKRLANSILAAPTGAKPAAERDTSADDAADVYAAGLKAGAIASAEKASYEATKHNPPGREWSIMDGFAVRPAFNGGMIVTDLYQQRWIAAFSDLDDFMIWVTGEHAKRTSTRD